MASAPMIPENWPKLLEPGLRFIFQQRLERREALGKRQYVYNVLDSQKAVEHATGIGALSDDDWNFEKTRRVQYGAVDPHFNTDWTHLEFAKGMTVERKLIDDNLYANSGLPRSVTSQPSQLADAAYVLREKAAAEPFNLATTTGTSPLGFPLAGPDAKALAATDHPLFPGDGGAGQANKFTLSLSVDSYDTVRQAMRAFTDNNGNIVQFNPTTLMVPPELETTALVAQQSIQKPGTANNDKNVVGSRIERVIVWDYLTDSNRWFVMDDMLREEHLLWFERVPLEFAATQDFDTFQAKYRAYMRYSRGFSDYRWLGMAEPS